MFVSRFVLALTLITSLFSQISHAQISKGNQILLDRGLQIQGMVQPDNYFHLDTYSNANYTAVNFLWNSTGNVGPISTFVGEPPGFPWARWASDEANMPTMGFGQTGNGDSFSRTNEIPYTNQLVNIQLGDEWNLNDDTIRTSLVDWFVAVRSNWPNSILYHNNWGGQIGDAQLYDFITRAQPDMLCFDSYPWQSVYDTAEPNNTGPAIPGPGSTLVKDWYGYLRQYREYAKGAGIPLAIYRQTFHAVQDYDGHVFRDPSPSELWLNTFAAMAFNAKFFTDFTYNTSSGSLFTKTFNGSGDSVISTNGLYAEITDVNKRARNLGKALTRLTPITIEGYVGYTTSMMIIRGTDANGAVTPIPIGFLTDQDMPGASYTEWVYRRNDPYLTNNWTITNLGAKNNGHPGDVIVSWFKPLDESFDGPNYTNETYMMVVNGLSDPTGTAADCLQEIRLNFHSSVAAVEMLNPLTGVAELQWLTLTNGFRQLVLNLNGGNAALFKFADGASFVGVQSTPVTGSPALTLHPVSRENLLGTDATFTAHAVGTALLTYQWQFNRVNIPGATANTFTRANVQFADAGSYTVIVSNAVGTATSTPADLTVPSSQPFFYEPFNYSNFGGPVTANTPVNWTLGGNNAPDDSHVTSGSLSYPGLTVPIGNSVTNGGIGYGLRRLIGTNVNSGNLYFSVLFRMNNLGYGAGGWNGLSSQVGALGATDNTSFRLQIMVRSNSSSGYVIGVQKGGTGASAIFDTTEYHTNETVLIVGKYDFNTVPNPVTLWINPNSSALGSGSAPTNSISANTGTDGFTIDRFNFRQNLATGANSLPAAMQWDELRIGNSWSDVTPRRVSFLTSLTGISRLGDGRFQFAFSTASGQSGSVYASTNLINWTMIGAATQIAPDLYQFIDANATNYARRFYQMRLP